jgi:RNA polymerase sigma-70 factor (ECF subfamily)
MLQDRFTEVLRRAQAGDPLAFAALWRDGQPMLLRYLKVIASGQAEDLASRTWLRVIERLGGFRGDEPAFRRWLVTIARHLHVDDVRRAARRPEQLVPEQPEEVPVSDAADLVLERLSTAAALRLIATLPPEQAEMVALRIIVGLDVADVARVTGHTPGAVRVAVHRGLRRLRDTLADREAVTPAGLPSSHP